jgi:transcriptional regulator with XRE-family HTH domain
MYGKRPLRLSKNYPANWSHASNSCEMEKGLRVSEQRGSSVRERRLAGELRRLRASTRMSGEEVGKRLGWSGSKVSRIESNRIGVKMADLRKLLDLYQVRDPRREELFALAREATEKSTLEVVAATFPREYAAQLQEEAKARSVWHWNPLIVPGLLQTADYARAVFGVWQAMFPVPPGEADRRIESRLLRQQLLTRDPPIALSVVIDESVLARKYGSKPVMRKQFERLLEVSELTNVEIRILPLEADAPMPTGAFVYMQFPPVHEVAMPDIVTLEDLEGNRFLEEEEQTYLYQIAFGYLKSRSLSPEQSRDLIEQTMNEKWS